MCNRDRNWLGMSVGHTALQQFKACHELFSLHNGLSWEATGVFFFQVILFNKPDKLCFARRQARRDQKGRYLGEKRQRLTPLNQLSSKYFIVHCMALGGSRRWQLTVSRLVEFNSFRQVLLNVYSSDTKSSISQQHNCVSLATGERYVLKSSSLPESSLL